MKVPDQYKFIIQLGKALHRYGVPSYKIQKYLHDISAKKNIKGSFMDTPTWVNYVFYDKDYHTYNYVDKVPPGGLDLGALSKVVEITNEVNEDKMTFKEAKREIERLKHNSINYGRFMEMIGFMFSAGAFCVLLDTGWVSSILAFFMGSVVYGITILADKYKYIDSTLESLVALVSTLITGVLSVFIDQIHISMTVLASIIVFIPGLAITTALEEITSKSLLSGTSKLFDALVSLFKQFFGVMLGLGILGIFIDLKPSHVDNTIPDWVDFFSVMLLAMSLIPVLRIRPKDAIYCVVAGFITFYTVVLFSFAGLVISIFLGTIVAVAMSKLLRKIGKSPELVYLVPGTIMLVPGSKAFIGLSSILPIADSTTPYMGMQAGYIFMGIIGGLIFSGSFIQTFFDEDY